MAKKSPFSKEQTESIRNQAIAFWEKSSTFMQPLFEAANDYERLYRCVLPKELADAYAVHTDKSALAPIDVYNNVNSLRAQMLAVVFASKPYAVLTVEGLPNLRSTGVEKAEQVLQHMNDISAFDKAADAIHLQALLFGIAPSFTQWTVRKERVPIRDEESYRIITDKNNKPIFQMKTVAEYAETIPLDLRRVRIDPSVDSIKERRLVGHEVVMSMSDVIAQIEDPTHYFSCDIKEIQATHFDSTKYYEYVYGERDMYAEKGDENEDFGDKLCWVREIRGNYRVTKSGRPNWEFDTVDCIVALGNDDKLLGVTINDLPIKGWEMYDFATIDSEPGRVFPMGVVEPIMDLWVEKFIKKNQSIDESNRSTYDRFVADKSATQDWDDILEHTPEQVYKVDLFATNARSVRDVFMEMPRATGSRQDTFQHSAVITDEIQQGMRLNDYRQGVDPSRKETATAVDALVGGGQALLEKMIKTLQMSFYAPVWKKHLILYNFFRGHVENVVYDNEGNGTVVNPGELDFYYKIDIDTTVANDRPGMIRRFVEMFPLMMEDPYVDGYQLRREAFKILKVPNPEKLLPPPEVEQMHIDRENAGLAAGAVLPVSDFDKHELHIEGHQDFLNFYANSGQANPESLEIIQMHMEDHQESLEKQSGSLANSKEMGGGAPNPDSASIKHKTGSGSGQPKENRT